MRTGKVSKKHQKLVRSHFGSSSKATQALLPWCTLTCVMSMSTAVRMADAKGTLTVKTKWWELSEDELLESDALGVALPSTPLRKRVHVRSANEKKRRFKRRVEAGVIDWQGHLVGRPSRRPTVDNEARPSLPGRSSCCAGVPIASIFVEGPAVDTVVTMAEKSTLNDFLQNLTTKIKYMGVALHLHLAISFALDLPVHNLSVAARALGGIASISTVNFVRQTARHANNIRHRPLAFFALPDNFDVDLGAARLEITMCFLALRALGRDVAANGRILLKTPIVAPHPLL